ncbi:hypothetical protein CD58_29170 [Pseudomonas brassicacearum]|nr:hypothetical protein CD58_29170 [Pseudomonas brassicacearum]
MGPRLSILHFGPGQLSRKLGISLSYLLISRAEGQFDEAWATLTNMILSVQCRGSCSDTRSRAKLHITYITILRIFFRNSIVVDLLDSAEFVEAGNRSKC